MPSVRSVLSSSKSSGSLSRGGSVSSIGGPNRDNIKKIVESDLIDVIEDEDLADVSDVISLGDSVVEDDVIDAENLADVNEYGESELGGGLSVDKSEFEDYRHSQPTTDSQPTTLPRGYIDDAITEDVMRDADERLKGRSFRINKKMRRRAIGLAVVLAIILVVSLSGANNSYQKKKIEEIIEDKATAYGFNDHDTYAEKITDGTAKNGTTTTAGLTVTAKNGTTTTAGPTVETGRIWDTEIPLDYETPFPLAMKHYLLDPRLQTPIGTRNEMPLFWQVPFGGGVFQSFMTACSKKVLASNHKLANDDTMMIYDVGDSSYVNADLSTIEGIENAVKLGLPESNLADVIVTNHIHFATHALLDATHKGRLFTALRHPVDRSISKYHYTITTSNDFFVKTMTLDEFVSSQLMDKDWITRFLIGKRQVPLVRDDLQLAKEILRRRCVVGIHERIELSIELFEQHFGWGAREGKDKCRDDLILREKFLAREVYEFVGHIKKDSAVYKKIVELNKFDMELYWYAHDLFIEQKEWFKNNG